MDVRRANELFELAQRLAADGARLRDALQVEFLAGQLAEVVRSDYDLGEVLGVERIFGGYSNLSFAVHTRDAEGEHRYFVRKYNRAITEREVRFEHALVGHINRRGLHLAARVYPAAGGATFVTREELLDGETVTRYFAVYEMLTGEDKYTWVKNRLTDREYESAGRVLAQFHAMAHDFEPGELAREQPPIMRFVRELPAVFAAYAAKATGDTVVDRHFLGRLPDIEEALRKGAALEPRLKGLPYIPVHCDYHPGNLKWVDEQGVGLFDFDWSKLDYRLFDVAEGLVYFCSSWEGHDNGELQLDKSAIFLRAYQDEAARFELPGPMGAAELAALPRMTANANLYVLNWDVSAYYEADEDLDDDEYLLYLEHQTMLMDFIEQHEDEIAELALAMGAAPLAAGEKGAGA